MALVEAARKVAMDTSFLAPDNCPSSSSDEFKISITSDYKVFFSLFIPLHEKFLQFDWLRAVVFQLNLKYLHVKITKLLWVVV